MSNGLMNEEDLGQWILRRLGAPFFTVELTRDHLDDAVEMARRWFAAKKGVRAFMMVPFTGGVTEYNLDEKVDTVLDVVFPANKADISMVFSPYILQDEKIPYDVFAAPNSAGLYSTFTQTLQYVEMAKKVIGADPDWQQDGRILRIFPIPQDNGVMRIDYKSHEFALDQLPERDHDMVKRYALACAKRDLGEIRGKYTEFASAQGSTPLNGAQLKQEASAEIESLNQEILKSGYPLGFIHG